jgi:hypothetical protein
MGKLSVKGHANLAREEESTAIVNVDQAEYNKYVALKNSRSKNRKKMESMEDELNSLKDDINEIKQLLRNLRNV